MIIYIPNSKPFRARVHSTSVAEKRQNELTWKKERGVIILGCGAYCIGSSVKFDWCAVLDVHQLRRYGLNSIISDHPYFEEMSLDCALDMYVREGGAGDVAVSVGGQIPANLAQPLAANILGTTAHNIEHADDWHQITDMLNDLGVKQPAWYMLRSDDEQQRILQLVLGTLS